MLMVVGQVIRIFYTGLKFVVIKDQIAHQSESAIG